MVTTLVCASIFSGFFTAGLAFYWDLSVLMVVLGYFLGSMLSTVVIIAFVVLRFEQRPASTEKQTPKTSPQMSN